MVTAFACRHAMVSFEHPEQVEVAAEICQSVALDNGAFSAWRSGRPHDFDGYASWAEGWLRHPAVDWCVVPDVIDGDESENDRLLSLWPMGASGLCARVALPRERGAPYAAVPGLPTRGAWIVWRVQRSGKSEVVGANRPGDGLDLRWLWSAAHEAPWSANARPGHLLASTLGFGRLLQCRPQRRNRCEMERPIFSAESGCPRADHDGSNRRTRERWALEFQLKRRSAQLGVDRMTQSDAGVK